MNDQERESGFQNEIIKDLQTNEKYKAYFSKFEPLSVANFITGFAFTKLMYTSFADMFQNEKERSLLGMFPEAFKCLAEIQQKKLFDKQCLWRAGTVDLEGITNTFHFNYWEQYIFACPFIEPVSESDVDLYMNYLNSSYEETGNWQLSFQDYSAIKEAIENDEEDIYPAWYEFYDTYRGTGMNIKLPDIRGQQEEFYRQLFFQQQREQEIKSGTFIAFDPSNKLPHLSSYNDKQVKEFIRLFGASNELELLENYNESKYNHNEQLDDAIMLLSTARELIPIEYNLDWKEAIIKSAQLYKNRLIARAMPLAFEEYQMKSDTGISFYDTIPSLEEDENACRVNEQIIKGKILNGESPDFDY